MSPNHILEKEVKEGGELDEAVYRSLYDSMSLGFLICRLLYDVDGIPNDFLLLAINPAYEERSGLKEEDVAGKRATDVLPYVEPAWIGLAAEAVRDRKATSIEEHDAALDTWFKASAVPLPGKDLFVMAFEDVTDRKKAVESESSLLLSLKASRSMVYSMDPFTGKVHSMKGVEWLLGYGQEEVEMRLDWWNEHIHVDDLPLCQAALEKIRERPGEHKLIYRIKRRDGEWLHVEDNAISLSGPDGRINRIAGTVTDITARKLAEEKASRYSSELKRSNEELQQFAYVASHDLQEPLRMVTTYLELLETKSGSELSPQGREFVKYAIEGSRRMRDLIDDLLLYSRIDSRPIEPELIDLNDIMSKVMGDLKVSIEESGAKLVIEPLPIVCADRLQMRQLLTNLVSNAIKFRTERPPRVLISSLAGEDEFTISVRDNGIGIDPRFKDKLFKMFSRLHTREEFPGTGIGLAVAKKIVERHDGSIWFESEPGKGTTFFFTLPA